MKKIVPSFQYQILIKIPCTNSKEWQWTRYMDDRSMEFFWLRRLNSCWKVNPSFFKPWKGVTFMGPEKDCISGGFFVTYGRLVQFWASPADSPVQIPALCRNDSSMQELETKETRKAAYYRKSLFIIYSQVSGCIFPKSFEILGTELLWLHVSVIFFGLTQEFAVSKFYSLGIKIIIHL